MTVRSPTVAEHVAATRPEQHWPPLLAPALPVAIPKPPAKDEPRRGFPLG